MGYYSKTEYSEKLRDPRWQKLRLQVFERAGWKCQACHDDKETLVVHHLVYCKGEPWDSPMEDLESLCESCHVMREEFNDWIGKRNRVPTGVVMWLWGMLCCGFHGTEDLWKQSGGGYRTFLRLLCDDSQRRFEERRKKKDEEKGVAETPRL